MNTKNKVKEFLGQYMDVATVADDDNIFEMRLVNSLFAMQLVNFIEQEFDVTLDNDELDIDNFKDINSIVSLIDSKIN
ncbi:MAG: acyl carrier protein [Acutalibacteraceae bacterium]|nr:acyl carrier protein [Acutalibacteraceae bacterium]